MSNNHQLTTPLLESENSGGDDVVVGDPESAIRPSSSLDLSDDFESHFTQRIPISTVLNFRGSKLRVIDTEQDQIILQQQVDGGTSTTTTDKDKKNNHPNKNNKVLVKRLSPATYTNRFLRVGYTLITILLLGFLFVFSLQVLLFLFISLPVDAGYAASASDPVNMPAEDGGDVTTEDSGGGGAQVHVLSIVNTILSFPIMLYGLASLMAMGSAFVVDTYNGASIFRSIFIESIYMLVYLIIPIFTFTICLLVRDPEPWRITAASWAISVAILFTCWGVAVTYKQVVSCFWLVEKYYVKDTTDNDGEDTTALSGSDTKEEGQDMRMRKKFNKLKKIAHQAVLLTQTARYSGSRKERYQYHTTEGRVSGLLASLVPIEKNMSLYSRLTALSLCSCLFETLDHPKRVYSSNEVREIVPFLTRNNFSMQKVWCSGNRRNMVTIARGPSALTTNQVKLSVLCTFISIFLLVFLIISALVWLNTGTTSYILVAIIGLLCCIVPAISQGLDTYRMYDSINEETDANDAGGAEDGTNLLQVWETYRITQPKKWYCYARILVEIVFFFLWPLIALFTNENYPIAVTFFLLSSFTFLWRYFSTLSILSELGGISDCTDKTKSHQQNYRISEIISRIVDNSARKIWSYIFIIFFLVALFLTVTSQAEADAIQPKNRNTRPPVLLVNDFYWEGDKDTLAYPTCKLTKGFEFQPGDVASHLADYSFMSAMAYETSEVVDYLLSEYFGPGNVVDEEDFVLQYREEMGLTKSAVYFKLFSFSKFPGYAVMSIRGSETGLDWLSNLQLWSASGLTQMVKWLTPFGWIFDSILPDLIYAVSKITAKTLDEVSYYRTTTKFVNDILENGYGESYGKDFNDMHITGVSLGGGLAIITGAQTNAYAVAFSGLGATLGRYTFDPPIEIEKLNAQTFNFIPERDYIAMIGGRAQLFQNGMCTAGNADLFGCHSMWRSICEINYRCGSNNRPVPCRCITEIGYPEPIQNGTRSFQEACQDAEQDWHLQFPPPTNN